MKRSVLSIVITGILLLIIAVPVTAEDSAITSIDPAVGYTGSSTTVTITGTNFNTSSVDVVLMKDDENNITSTVSSISATQIVCKFTFSSSKEPGDWTLVVINEDDTEAVYSGDFTLRAPMELSSITPDFAQTNNESVDITIVGTGLSDVESFYLYDDSYGTIAGADIDVDSSTTITGVFDLADADIGTYDVCVKDSFVTEECDLSFEVTTDELGNIDVSSSPTGAAIYVDSSYKGVTPDSIEGLAIGSHKVILKKSGYDEWAKMVQVTAGDTTSVDATLTAVTTAPTPAPTVAAVVITTATLPPTTVKSSRTVPTPWADSTMAAPTAATTESPVEIGVILAALAACIVVLGRK